MMLEMLHTYLQGCQPQQVCGAEHRLNTYYHNNKTGLQPVSGPVNRFNGHFNIRLYKTNVQTDIEIHRQTVKKIKEIFF